MAGTLILQPFANAGDVNAPPQTDPSGFVNFAQGYTPFYEISLSSGNPQAKAVERGVQNYLFNILTANDQQIQQLGFAEWFGSMPSGYTENAHIMRYDSGASKWRLYRSLVSGNVTDPLTTPASWELVPFAFEMNANIPMPSGGSAGSSSEVVTVSTDFNTLTNGTWEIKTDAIASGSANSPVAPAVGSSAAAGLLESKSWLNGATVYIAQRYLDRNGNSFFRGATNGTWTAWVSTSPASNYAVDTGAANAIAAAFYLKSSTIPDNTVFWVKIKANNTGATTFTPNATLIPTPKPVVGQAGLALQGGELVVDGRAMLVYRTNTDDFALVYCSGGAVQVPSTASGANQAVSLSQVNSLITAAVGASVNKKFCYFIGQS